MNVLKWELSREIPQFTFPKILKCKHLNKFSSTSPFYYSKNVLNLYQLFTKIPLNLTQKFTGAESSANCILTKMPSIFLWTPSKSSFKLKILRDLSGNYDVSTAEFDYLQSIIGTISLFVLVFSYSIIFKKNKKCVHCIFPCDGVTFPDVSVSKDSDSPLKHQNSPKIAVICTLWNPQIVSPLLENVVKTLNQEGIGNDAIDVIRVPGSFELPVTCKALIDKEKYDAIVCIGCLIKGDSYHFEYISQAVSNGLINLQLINATPIVYGVLNCATLEQAKERARDDAKLGYSWAKTAIHMIHVIKEIRESASF